jgi:hypothetical protein
MQMESMGRNGVRLLRARLAGAFIALQPLLLKAAVCGGEIQLTIGLRHLMDMEDCDGDQGNCKEDSYEEGAGEKDGSEEVNA